MFDSTPPPGSPGPSTRPTIPDAISIATELWIAVIVGQIVAFIAQYDSVATSIRDQVRDSAGDLGADQVDLMTSTGFVVGTMVVATVVLSAIPAVFVLLTRAGRNWARIGLAALGVYVAVNALLSLFSDIEPLWAMVPLVISGVAAMAATVILMRPDSAQYCKDMAEFRKPKPPVGYPTPYPYGSYPPVQPPVPPAPGVYPPPGYGGPAATGNPDELRPPTPDAAPYGVGGPASPPAVESPGAASDPTDPPTDRPTPTEGPQNQ
ncbi:hypothetical protein QSJ18_05075 [Gordonia sp. ABSL1-1]|uniref:hypothetical protein n=1 Tax=Gordonia sp. ABSL1-1 TaxID=3053923 RepID=UPI0025725961|nr:hypothetical protein [Gordonia sp. ABSL1-1]MDL9936105.1 hypothetical protein [Gordonia sp. ABSL1-1]